MTDLATMGKQAKEAARQSARLQTAEKNAVLERCAAALIQHQQEILAANRQDIENAAAGGIKPSFIDRLTLTEQRIVEMADGLKALVALEDPTSEFVSMKTLPNGLVIGCKRVPLGVVGIIYEARPNVTADAFALCLKSGNASIFRGGKEAICSNKAMVALFQNCLETMGYNPHIVQLVTDTSRETAREMMGLKQYIDVLIPRGGAGLIQSVVENSTIPVIETGVGNCHIYVDQYADDPMAVSILLNAKTQRPSVCNACETLLVHEAAAPGFLPKAWKVLVESGVEIRGDEAVRGILPKATAAEEKDWETEYNDMILAVKIVPSIDAAMAHIHEYGTGHSEAIITDNYANAQRFLNEVDAAAVYVNASTRFTDGYQFGFGAEIGISTQKLHARGPMGLRELTTKKYIVYGNGHIRES